MPRAFLSHSNRDKGYIEVIAKRLGKSNIAYDSFTFEEGNKTLDEIYNELKGSDIFVYFISNYSLESSWVNTELEKAEQLFKKGNIKKFLPIIIDKSINYDDKRIPLWMRQEYNLQFISRPTKAFERIKQTLRIVSWDLYPKNREIDQLFIGRTDLIKEFEERIFNIDLLKPISLIASGFPSIGRKKFLLHCLKNTNIIREYYKPPIISLGNRESIENFIINLYDLGYSEKIDLTNLMTKTIENKIKIALSLVKDLDNNNNILFIEDNYCIVGRDGEIVSWFDRISQELEANNHIIFCVISRNKVKASTIINKNYLYTIFIPGLNKREREALFQSYLNIENIELDVNDFKTISELFTGFPIEIQYTVNLIKTIGLQELLNNLNYIVDFNSEHVSRIINEFREDEKANKLFRLFASYEFLSFELVEKILGDNFLDYKDIITNFSNRGIIEFLGPTKEYFKLNDSIKDFIQRTSFGVPEEFIPNIISHTKEVIKNYNDTLDRDISDYINSIQYALLNNIEVPPQILIPSHFVNTMRELYNYKRQYDNVVRLAEKVLENEKYLDERLKREVRYWLCLALARKKDSRLVREVQHIHGADHDFILGFYYRLTNQYSKAIDRLKAVLSSNPNFYRAKRELVQVYLNLEEYDLAYNLAKDNYESDKNNPYNLQSYFRCLIYRSMNTSDKKLKLETLLKGLSSIPSEKAQEMYRTSKAQYEAFILHDKYLSINTINETIEMYPTNIYPRLTKLDICIYYNDFIELENTISQIENDFKEKAEIFHRIGFWKAKIKLLIEKGFSDKAELLITSKIKPFFPEKVVEKFLNSISLS